ncbi:uncharacterized protein [Cardiocondyla obscurior]
MSQEIADLLKNLGLEKYIVIFENHQVTIDLLKYMTEDNIKDLIPLIGHRVIFLNYWRNKYCSSNASNSSEGWSKDNESEMSEKETDNSNILTFDKKDNLRVNTFSSNVPNLQTMSSIRDILKNTAVGELIIKQYESKSELSCSCRSKLCDIIITYLQDNKMKRNNDTIREIANKIVEAFPNEHLKTYYVSPVKKKSAPNKKPIPARGKLVNLWRNRDYNIKKYRLQDVDETDNIIESESDNFDHTVRDSLEWLGKHQAPWETVLIHWNITYDIRRSDLQQCKDKILSNIFEKWQLFKHPLGHELIEFDFNKMNLTKQSLNIEIWKQFIEHILEHTAINKKDNTATILIEQYNSNSSKDTKVAASLMLLAHLFPSKKIIRHNKQFYKPSIADAKESIIKRIHTCGDVTINQESLKKKAEELNITVQPYILIVGTTLDDIRNHFISIDDVLYSVNFTLEAVDLCFKVFQVFHMNYPIFSEHLWIIIQRDLSFPLKNSTCNATKQIDVLENIVDKSLNVHNMLSMCASYLQPIPEDKFTLEKFKSLVEHGAVLLIAKLYATSNMSRKLIIKFINNIKSFYNTICFEALRKKCTNSEITNMFQIVEHVFDNFKSEYMTLEYFQKNNYLIMPLQTTVDTYIKLENIKNVKKLKIYRGKLSVIPMKQVFKQFLELPKVYDSITLNVQNMINNFDLISIYTGKIWDASINIYNDKIILPLVLFFDDVEINNPLGTHKNFNKLGAVYCSLACIPEEYASLLENIFLFQFHKYEDHKKLGNKKIFSLIIDEILFLCNNGIVVEVNKEKKLIFFSLCYIAGDNLGLNTILGFSKSFNSSHCCRMCTISKTESKTQVNENIELLRTIDNYNIHVTERNFGVQENCIFNVIPNFHVINNCSVDPMHDLYEGICRYNIAKILKNFIYEEKLFSLSILNERIRNFDCISSKTINFRIQPESIKNELIILSASEMKYLVYNFPFFIGDLIPNNNKIWKLFLTVRKIICIIMFRFMTLERVDTLKNLITEYLQNYLKLFHTTLKVKHHNLLHYPRIIKKYGPLRNLSCIRFEAKHKIAKFNAKITSSRQNSSFTLAFREQLRLCYRFVCKKGFENRVFFLNIICKVPFLSNYEQLKKDVPYDISNFDCVKSVEVNGTYYNIGDFLVISSTVNISSILYGKIKYILINAETNAVFFLYIGLKNIIFSEHLSAIEVVETLSLSFICQKDITHFETCVVKIISDKRYYVLYNY